MAKLTKNRGRSRFLNFCKAIVFNDDTTISKRGHHTYNSKDLSNLKRVEEKLDSMLGKDYPKIFRTTRKENGIGKNFSNALKHVFSDTSLGKKIYKGSLGSYNKLSSKFEKLFIPTKSSFKDLLNTTSRMSRSTSTDDFSLFTTSTVPSPSSSSSSSSSTASLRSTSQKKQFTSFHRSTSWNNMQVYDNVKEKEIALRYNANVGTYSLLICLLVLIFCGKVCAIICTSTWFYFAPCCFKRID
ncbi:uncharacterized protein LOC107877406 [Capsicum annuum]|uniref:uncharacterized protein LOC107877406 n=1 Tax=Capsicum annuum TaxID=4072 RepID=UPI001FB0B569|nr:uncharacterized protein LOC107877406 [Capsicum annuum]